MMRKLEMPLPTPYEYNKVILQDDSIFTKVQNSTFIKLVNFFIRERLFSPQTTDSITEMWCQMAFSLIVFGHACNKQAIHAICYLEVRDVLPAFVEKQFYWLPRVDSVIQVTIPTQVSLAFSRYLFAIQADNHFENLSDIPANLYLLPDSAPVYNTPSTTQIKKIRTLFQRWLKKLVRDSKLGYDITVSHLIQFGANRTNSLYSNYVTGYLLGHHIIDSVSPGQADLLAKLRLDTNILEEKPIFQQSDNRKYITRRTTPSVINVEIKPIASTLEKVIATVKTIDGLKIPKNIVLECKENFRMIHEYCNLSTPPKVGNFNKPESNSQESLIDKENISLIASWMESLLKGQKNTFAGYASDVIIIWKNNQGIRMTELEYTDIAESLDGYLPATRNRKASAMNSFREFLVEVKDISVKFPPINVSVNPQINCTYLLSPDQIHSLAILLGSWGRDGQCAALSALLGGYWGLRIHETIFLQIDQIESHSKVVIHVNETKRASNRTVVGEAIPDWVKYYLFELIKVRKLEPGKPISRRLLSIDGAPLTKCHTRYLLDKALATLGIPATHHSFRHFWVNRLIALGYLIPDIAIMAHHFSADTTVSSYSHIAPLLQAEQTNSNKYKNDPLSANQTNKYIRISQLGIIRGKSDRANQPDQLLKDGIQLFSKTKIGDFVPSPDGFFLQIQNAVKFLIAKSW